MSAKCSNCGVENSGNDFCTECGKPLSPTSSAAKPVTAPVVGAAPVASKGLIVTGFVLSLVGLLIFAIPFGVAATIMGSIAMKRGARGLAVATLVIGIVDIVFGFIFLLSMGRFF